MAEKETSSEKHELTRIIFPGIVAIAVATIGGYFTYIASSKKDDKESDAVTASSPNSAAYADIFRPKEIYPRAVGDLRIDSPYSLVKTLKIGTQTPSGNSIGIEIKKGPFKYALVSFSSDGKALVESIDLQQRDPDAYAAILRDAKDKLGKVEADKDGHYVWHSGADPQIKLVLDGTVHIKLDKAGVGNGADQTDL